LEGLLKLSLVTCPIALFPATSETEKVSFNQINRNTGHRIKYTKVDAETGDEVSADDIIKGYKVDTDTYVTVEKEELENLALESTRTIDIDEFVPRSEIDELYLVRPYYIVPEGRVGHDAYAVIRETIRTMDKVAIARVVLTNREHIISLEARGKGLVGMLLRYPYEIRDENEYFDDIQDVKVTKEMLDLARHIVETKSADFEPAKFEDRYENALVELLNQKRKGEPVRSAVKPRDTGNVINLMDALRKSLNADGKTSVQSPSRAKKSKKPAAGQKEMLMAITGKGESKPKAAAKETKRTSRQRKAG
jgi:DNA end-binding protein Ku